MAARILTTRRLVGAPSFAGAVATLAAETTAFAQAPPPANGAVKPLSDSLTGLAKAEYEAAKILYGTKDHAKAIVKFGRAYEISREPRLLFNIAVCQKNLRRY